MTKMVKSTSEHPVTNAFLGTSAVKFSDCNTREEMEELTTSQHRTCIQILQHFELMFLYSSTSRPEADGEEKQALDLTVI